MNPMNFLFKKAKSGIKDLPVIFGSNGLKLNGRIFLPDGASADSPVPGAVLCHGFGSSQRAMKDSARMMASKGIATFIFDFRGHGVSEGAVDGSQSEDAVDAWNALRRFPQVNKSRMGIIGHSLGAMSAILAAGKVDSPRMLIALSCPPMVNRETFPEMPEDLGRWGSEHSHIVEYPRQGSFPWLTGVAAILARVWMYVTDHHVRVDVKKFLEGMVQSSMVDVVKNLENCSKLFVFCEGDTVTPYTKSVLVYEAACEPKLKFLDRGNHSTPIMGGSLHLQWIDWAVKILLD